MAETSPTMSALDGGQRVEEENGPPKPDASNSRRRTKTGCLTCRRRRIKCGEERPICANCTKSKRNCEGYNQRVVFKVPMQGPMSNIPSHSGTLPRTSARGIVNQQPLPNSTQNSSLASILPRSQSRDGSAFVQPTHVQGFVNNNQSTFGQQPSAGMRMSREQKAAHSFDSQNPSWQQYEHRSVDPDPPRSFNDHERQSFGVTPQTHQAPSTNVLGTQNVRGTFWDNQSTPQETPSSTESDGSYWAATQPQVSPNTLINTTTAINLGSKYTDEVDEDDDNDPYDVSSDDEMIDADNVVALRARDLQRHIAASNLQAVMKLQAQQDRQNTRVRTYRSVIENFGSDMLSTYEPSYKESPLSDPAALGIFTHFLNVVAPGINMYERHPANPSLLLHGQTLPKSQQHLWAYTLPNAAMKNHGLMHAMLAVSSLHIAKLQDTPTWISLKHYHYAIRKLAKNVSVPGKRIQLATLATTLLLGFYEVMSADHSKWCDHLLGSQQLIKHIDFAGMTKYLKQRKMQLAHEKAMSLTSANETSFDLDGEDEDQDAEDDVDENLVGLLMGKKVDYGEMGEVIEDWEGYQRGPKPYTPKDLDTYETQRDLFWWFLKQDTIQSILSQNRLFINYERWSHCPPRAPIGRRDAVHGTFDHLILLLGRLSDFTARDLPRKKQATGVPPPKPPRTSHAPQSGSVCATNAKNAGVTDSTVRGGPPAGMQGGPPPGWQGPPPPGWTGGQQPDSGGAHRHKISMAGNRALPADECPIAAAAAAKEAAQASSTMQGGPPLEWQEPPPPGWRGGPPPFASSEHGESSHAHPAFQSGSRGRWQGPPPPGWAGPPPPGVGSPSQSVSKGSPSMPQLPPFAGMLPTGERHLPRGFSPDASSPSAGEDSDGCPNGRRMAAEEEWSDIGRAFAIFKEQLGPDFQELGADYNPPIDSPFGPAIQYRGYNITVIWLMYYMGLIVWHRAHPSQLPSAMVAAAMTAQETNQYAIIIGRIAAGMAPDARTTTTVAISTGSGLNDSVFALFVAGVQYQGPAQRRWVIQRMLDTERLTGWETATQVAKGLETAWTTAAKMGRGPPYERYVEPAPVNMIWNRATQRMDRMLESAGDQTHVKAHNGAISSRAAWATGILGIENKLAKINISSKEEEEDEFMSEGRGR